MNTYVLTMVYSNAAVWRAGMASLHKTVDMRALNARHVILNQHYPLQPEEVDAEIARYLAEPKAPAVTMLDAGHNLGLHEGLNYMLEKIGPLDDDDVVVGFDADEDPLKAGWLDAMLRVFAADPKCGWLSLMSPNALDYMKAYGADDRVVGGEAVMVPGYSLINTVCAWRGAALKAVGKLTEPHLFYGGFEGTMMPRFMGAGYWIGWLSDYNVTTHHGLADAEYHRYKRHHVGFDLPLFPGSFADWIAQK